MQTSGAIRAARTRSCIQPSLQERKRRPRPPKLYERGGSNPALFFSAPKVDRFAGPVIGPRFARTRWLAMTIVVVSRLFEI